MLKTIKHQFTELFQFIQSPRDRKRNHSTKRKYGTFLFILILDVLLSLLVILLFKIFKIEELLSSNEHLMDEMMRSIPLVTTLIILVLLIPFIEEVIFRLPLRFSNNLINILAIQISKLFGKENSNKFKKKYKRAWYKSFGFTFYFSVVVFALIHSANYRNSIEVLHLWPLLVLPQFIAGTLMAYLRVKYDFYWGFRLHMLHNLIFLLPVFIMGNVPNEVYKYKGDDCSIVIYENIPFKDKELKTSYEIQDDGLEMNHFTFKNLTTSLFSTETDFLFVGAKGYYNRIFSIKYREDFTIRSQERDTLHSHLKEAFKFIVDKDTVFNTQLWLMYICNDSLLDQHEVPQKGTGINVSNKRIFTDGADLNSFNNKLRFSSRFSSNVAFKLIDHSNKYYAIEINTRDWDEMRAILRTEYGIGLIYCQDYALRTKLLFYNKKTTKKSKREQKHDLNILE